MATFHLQVEALTGIAIDGSSSPSEDELSQFLKDGVMDVTNKWLTGHPNDIYMFGKESAETTSNNSLNLNGAKIISVVREDGTDNQWRGCTQISPSMQYEVTDTDSLNYASATNPVYMIGDAGKISVFPAPGSAPNAFKVYYVNKDAVNGSGSALAHAHDDILYFPIDKVYLVVLYASIQALHSKMGDTSITALSINTVPPDTPSAPSFSYTNAADDTSIDSTIGAITDLEALGSAPTYTPPAVGGSTEELTANMSTGNSQTDFSDWVEKAGDYIQTDEDVELANAQISKINTYLSAYSQAMQNQVNEFNEANTKYQAEIREHLQESQNEVQRLITIYNKVSDINLQNAINTYRTQVDEYSQRLSKYSQEIAGYNADVGREVQQYTQNLQQQVTNYQWTQGQMVKLQSQYNQAFAIPSSGEGE